MATLKESKVPILYVAKILRRFLEDENGKVQSLQMECLMPKYSSGNVLQAAPSHLPTTYKCH